MKSGIYAYVDKKNDEIVYVGKDSNISKNSRHRAHISSSHYNDQPFNKVLQNNPGRFEYKILKSWNKDEYNKNLTNALEIIYIRRYNPRFNYTKGGEGMCGYKHTEQTKNKMSEAHKGKTHSPDTKRKIREGNLGKTRSPETRAKMSEAQIGNKNGRKYALWNPEKCQYDKGAMFQGNRDGSKPYRCFMTRYNGKKLPIGFNMDFVSCELVHDLIDDACKNE